MHALAYIDYYSTTFIDWQPLFRFTHITSLPIITMIPAAAIPASTNPATTSSTLACLRRDFRAAG